MTSSAKNLACLGRQVFVNFELHHCTSSWHCQHALVGELSGIRESCTDGVFRHRGIIPPYLFRRCSRSQVVKNDGNHDACPSDARLAVAHGWIHRYVFRKIHLENSLPYRSPNLKPISLKLFRVRENQGIYLSRLLLYKCKFSMLNKRFWFNI